MKQPNMHYEPDWSTPPNTTSSNVPLTLYELNSLVGDVIQLSLPTAYWVQAELVSLNDGKGHCYMELVQKDIAGNTPVATARAICWRGTWQRLRPKFERSTGQRMHPGMKVLLQVKANFHAAFGFAWIVQDIDPSYTLGDMARRRLEIIRTLKQEGIFEMQKELTLSPFAMHIAVISSDTAAGYGDFCNQLAGFTFRTQLFPSVMQGEGVEQGITSALGRIYEQHACGDEFDAVVIIRGGGSTADLSGFDTLQLAENVAQFPLPIITGIGHDRDESILDMVSCIRVKTPTAAADLLNDNLQQTIDIIAHTQQRMLNSLTERIGTEQDRLQRLASTIPLLFSLVKTKQDAVLDSLQSRCGDAAKTYVNNQGHQLALISQRLGSLSRQRIMQERHRVEILRQRLENADPRLLLRRGYSMTLWHGKPLRNSSLVKAGEELTTILEHGTIKSTTI